MVHYTVSAVHQVSPCLLSPTAGCTHLLDISTVPPHSTSTGHPSYPPTQCRTSSSDGPCGQPCLPRTSPDFPLHSTSSPVSRKHDRTPCPSFTPDMEYEDTGSQREKSKVRPTDCIVLRKSLEGLFTCGDFF